MSKKFGGEMAPWVPGGGSTWVDNLKDKYADKGSFKRCFESHPALELAGFKVYGGSCSAPVVKDADIYIGFDYSMTLRCVYPWHDKQIDQILFPITDRKPPHDADEFKKMVEWASVQVIAGRKLHAGCIGGHGRTGTFLAALTFVMTGEKDAIEFVRKNYCDRAVETDGQVNFLHKHYGITKTKGSDYHKETTSSYSGYSGYDDSYSGSHASKHNEKYGFKSSGTSKQKSLAFSNATHEFQPMPNSVKSIW